MADEPKVEPQGEPMQIDKGASEEGATPTGAAARATGRH